MAPGVVGHEHPEDHVALGRGCHPSRQIRYSDCEVRMTPPSSCHLLANSDDVVVATGGSLEK